MPINRDALVGLKSLQIANLFCDIGKTLYHLLLTRLKMKKLWSSLHCTIEHSSSPICKFLALDPSIIKVLKVNAESHRFVQPHPF